MVLSSLVKASPDAYMQMAIQLGYYKQIGEPCATYETASTRQFRNGRTETTRTLSKESLAFCKAMQDPSVKVSPLDHSGTKCGDRLRGRVFFSKFLLKLFSIPIL